jgi:hypothetical protein
MIKLKIIFLLFNFLDLSFNLSLKFTTYLFRLISVLNSSSEVVIDFAFASNAL